MNRLIGSELTKGGVLLEASFRQTLALKTLVPETTVPETTRPETTDLDSMGNSPLVRNLH